MARLGARIDRFKPSMSIISVLLLENRPRHILLYVYVAFCELDTVYRCNCACHEQCLDQGLNLYIDLTHEENLKENMTTTYDYVGTHDGNGTTPYYMFYVQYTCTYVNTCMYLAGEKRSVHRPIAFLYLHVGSS